MSATFKSEAAKSALRLIGLSLVMLAFILCASGESVSTTNETPFERAERLAKAARERWQAQPTNAVLAWLCSRACFDAAEFARPDALRAQFAQEGIDAARTALKLDPNSAPAHYYLGMNLGQLARTKRLGALRLVDEMEPSFFSAIRLDPRFDFAGAHRCLGLLYRDAPGWPISVGSRAKARQHLSKAVELAKEYPDNWICLIEAYLNWGEKERARRHLQAAQEHIDAARKKFTGVEWKTSWEDWDKRLEAIRSKLQVPKLESPKAK